ncbi:MAG: DUF5615 family PIN-like protein [Actinomycetota bacterium]|nr:DUF5615 family PIN-like protein [Actinomycetota bacterium]
MRFLIDANLSPALAEGLRKARHDAVHVRDYDLQSASDEVALARAREEKRALVSADSDFAMELARTGERAPSVIMFRRPSGRRASQQLMLMLAMLADLEQPLADGAVAVIEADRVRVRALPIS